MSSGFGPKSYAKFFKAGVFMSVRYRSRSRTNLFLVLVLSLFCILLIGFGVSLCFIGVVDRMEIQLSYQG